MSRARDLGPRVDTFVRTCTAVCLLPIGLLLCCVAATGLALAGAAAPRVHRIYVAFARFCLRVGGTSLIVHGAERVDPDRAYVLVPNHESSWDPPCILVGLPRLVMRFVVKHQLMDLPILGQALRLTGNVRVVRTQTARDAESIRTVMHRRDSGVSILFFAEGRRSRDGALHSFKMGAFATALEYGLPILPIGIAGPRPIWPATSIHLRRGSVALEIGEPIGVEGLTLEDREALRDRTLAAVRRLRTRARE
ncbi:MAG: lysophospholipid acyltransferase family protein, partial [Planctomycetota bacterium]